MLLMERRQTPFTRCRVKEHLRIGNTLAAATGRENLGSIVDRAAKSVVGVNDQRVAEPGIEAHLQTVIGRCGSVGAEPNGAKVWIETTVAVSTRSVTES